MGWRSKDERELVGWAQKRGWTMLDRNGQGHMVMVWPPTGLKVPVAGSARSHTLANARKQMQRAETAPVWGTRLGTRQAA